MNALAQLDRRELRREPVRRSGPDHEQRRDPADEQRGPPAVADGLAVDRAEPGDPRPRPGPAERPRGVGRGHAAGPTRSTGCSPYWARKTSSRFGSRLTTSTRPCGRGGRDDGADRAADPHRDDVAGRHDVAGRPGVASKMAGATGVPKLSSTWWKASRRMASIESTWTSRPSRMIATRSQVRSTSSMMWLDRKIVRPASRASRTMPKNVCWTSGSRPGRRLVEDQQVGPVLERDDQPDLLLVALRVLLEPAARVEVERARRAPRRTPCPRRRAGSRSR